MLGWWTGKFQTLVLWTLNYFISNGQSTELMSIQLVIYVYKSKVVPALRWSFVADSLPF